MADSESIMSVTTGTDQDEVIPELSDGEFYKLIQETIRANEVLKNETEMFEKFYVKVDPKDSISTLTVASVPSIPSQDVHIRGRRKVAKRRSSGSDDTMWLAPDQKCDIAMWELEEVRDELDRLHMESERILDNCKANLEEADIRISEMRKAMYEFERDICKGAINSRTNKVVAERVVRQFEDKIKSKDVLMEKLRLKNASLRVQKKKIALQLRQKEEMGEVLHEVDFNQLKIENKQYLEKIDEKNQELLRLKLMAGNTLQILNHFKKKLYERTSESDRLYSEIDTRKESLIRFEEETLTVEEERLTAEKRNIQLRRRLADYRVPHVQEYVQKKADLSELRKTVKSWERKVEIAQMALNTHKKTWQQLWAQNQQAWMQSELSSGRIN